MGAGGTTPPPSPSFTVSLSPASLTVAQGQSQKTEVSVAAQNGFTGTVSVTVTGLPSGVTALPATLSVTPGTPESLSLAASSSATLTQASVSVNGAAPGLSAAATLSLTVQGAPVRFPYQAVGGFLSSGFFDTKRQLLFATNSELNELDVISPTDLSVKARVPLPSPSGIDQMPDGNTLVVGTNAQEVFTVNEDTYAVTRYPAPLVTPETGPGLPIWETFYLNPLAMANGKVLLIDQPFNYTGGYLVYDNPGMTAVWNSNANTFTFCAFGSNDPSCLGGGVSARSADGKWACIGSSLYSSDSGSFTSAPIASVNPPGGILDCALNSDGSKIALVSPNLVTFVDRSFNVLGTVAISGTNIFAPGLPGPATSGLGGAQFSPDGSQLFLYYWQVDNPGAFSSDGVTLVEAIDANGMVPLGYYEAALPKLTSSNNLSFLGVDNNGQVYFGNGGGVAAVNTTLPPIAIPAGETLPSPLCPSPSTTSFPLNSSFEVPLAQGGVTTGTGVYLGGSLATLSTDTTGAESMIEIPASSTPGPVGMECVDPSGYVTLIPSAISYGVLPVASSATLLPTSGSPTIDLYGFGFYDASQTLPAVAIGGATATVVGPNPGVFPAEAGSLQDVQVQAPSGSAGQSASISVTSSIGTGTLANAVTYLSGTTIVPASGIVQLLFDSHRNLLYALKANEVDVLNPDTLQWQRPLQLPSSVTSLGFSWIALSPDATKMVIAASGENVIVLNPDEPAQAVLVHNPYGYSDIVAITQSNIALLGGNPDAALDLTSFSLTPENSSSSFLVKASADGSHLYNFSGNAEPFVNCAIDPTTFTQQCDSLGEVPLGDLAVSPDGSQFAVALQSSNLVVFFDSTVHFSNTTVNPDLSPPTAEEVVGATYSPQGKVLMVGLANSIEFWDSAQGTLRGRLMTPEALEVVAPHLNLWAPMMALDPAGQTIYAVSASGISVLKLPTPLDQMAATQWPLAVPGGKRGAFQGTLAERFAAMKAQSGKGTAARP